MTEGSNLPPASVYPSSTPKRNNSHPRPTSVDRDSVRRDEEVHFRDITPENGLYGCSMI